MKFFNRTTQLLFALTFSSGTFASDSEEDVPLVKTSSGLLRGFSPYPSVQAWLGIPYAAPPVGELRFQPPEKYSGDSKAVRDATRLGSACYQANYFTMLSDKAVGVAESEDCLNLNIWKPTGHNNLLPVLIFIYGGGFVLGSNNIPGAEMVSEQKDIMVVSFNYRLNVFGFPNHPSLPHKNPGLLDQRLALLWLRDNIRSFGGDPARMTLMGQSAGASSIASYSFAYADDPIVSGLFQMSGQPETLPPDDGSSWKALVNATGCAGGDEVGCLKRLPARALKRGINADNWIQYGDPAGGTPVADNVTYFAPAEARKLGLAGKFAKIPLLASSTLNEGDNLLPWSPTAGVPLTLSDQITEFAFHCPTVLSTSYRLAYNIPIYRYLYSGTFPALSPYPWARAYHGADIFLFFFAERYLAYEEAGTEVVAAGVYLRGAVASFVRGGGRGLEGWGWPRYTGEGKFLSLGARAGFERGLAD
ncbi:hypothetical protein MMC30_004239 [Trapelia coarctata]|nr:hypothetical protein [Trapelia coarctata]